MAGRRAGFSAEVAPLSRLFFQGRKRIGMKKGIGAERSVKRHI
jgi:hypothetical protein